MLCTGENNVVQRKKQLLKATITISDEQVNMSVANHLSLLNWFSSHITQTMQDGTRTP